MRANWQRSGRGGRTVGSFGEYDNLITVLENVSSIVEPYPETAKIFRLLDVTF